MWLGNLNSPWQVWQSLPWLRYVPHLCIRYASNKKSAKAYVQVGMVPDMVITKREAFCFYYVLDYINEQ